MKIQKVTAGKELLDFLGNPHTHRQESTYGCSEAQVPLPVIAGDGTVSLISTPHIYLKIYTFPVSLLSVMIHYRFGSCAVFLKRSS